MAFGMDFDNLVAVRLFLDYALLHMFICPAGLGRVPEHGYVKSGVKPNGVLKNFLQIIRSKDAKKMTMTSTPSPGRQNRKASPRSR